MRRSAVEPMLGRIERIHDVPEWHITRALAAGGEVLHIPIVGRYWRQHPDQHHLKLRRIKPPHTTNTEEHANAAI